MDHLNNTASIANDTLPLLSMFFLSGVCVRNVNEAKCRKNDQARCHKAQTRCSGHTTRLCEATGPIYWHAGMQGHSLQSCKCLGRQKCESAVVKLVSLVDEHGLKLTFFCEPVTQSHVQPTVHAQLTDVL